MRFLQSLFGGILGSALGLGAYYAINQTMQRPVPWTVLIIGLLAGLGVRLICGRNRSGLTGIVAATTALTALLGFNYSVIALAQQGAGPVIAEHVNFDEEGRPIHAEEEEEEESLESDTDEETSAEPEPTATVPVPLSDGKPIQVADVFSQPNMAMAQSSPMELAALAITGLLAYLLGRGSGKPAAAASVQQAETDAAPAT